MNSHVIKDKIWFGNSKRSFFLSYVFTYSIEFSPQYVFSCPFWVIPFINFSHPVWSYPQHFISLYLFFSYPLLYDFAAHFEISPALGKLFSTCPLLSYPLSSVFPCCIFFPTHYELSPPLNKLFSSCPESSIAGHMSLSTLSSPCCMLSCPFENIPCPL